MSRGSGYTQPGNWKTTVPRILRRDGYACYICGGPAVSVDHIIPVASGGSHHDDNLGSICAPCKTAKDEQDRLAGIAARKALRQAHSLTETHPNARRG